MTVIEMKKASNETFMWIRHTLLVLAVMEVFVAHWLAYLYVTNFKMEIKPVVTVEASPIIEIKK